MKVTLDLDVLLARGDIDRGEYDKLRSLSQSATATLAFNIVVAFGMIAIASATFALMPTTATAIALGIGVCAAGLALVMRHDEPWRLLAVICVVAGALLAGGGMVKLGEGSIASFLLVAMLFAAVSVTTRSAVMAVLAVLALSSCLGARTGYLHAVYFLGIEAPLLTIVVFAALAALLQWGTSRMPLDYRGIATAAARASVFLVNFGFWIGSLWGDRAIAARVSDHASIGAIPMLLRPGALALAWAIALVAAGVWAFRHDRRWLVTVVAVFGAIDLYTQWFERLGASPASVLTGGLFALAFALALESYHAKGIKAA
ncbi:MAG TPA: hypothetical protein VKV24_06925 [Casimicrobiaceae bacterium]|nr:hypothetical protein [Casimicrobiaceae bacterium]